MANVVYSQKALSDLEEIGDYISMELQNPIAALNTVTKIQDKIDKLAGFPYIGALLSSIFDDIEDNDYRYLVCMNYLAFYRVDGNTVYIDRIIYGRRDYITILFGNPPKNEE